MASGDVWKVTLDMTWGTVVCHPGFWLVEGSGGGDPSPQVNVAAAVEAALGASALAGFSDQCHLIGTIISDLQPGVLPTVNIPFAAPIDGDIVDVNPLPPQSAAVISWQTGVKGTVGTFATAGRTYMPGIPQNGQISGFLQATFQTAVDTFATKLWAAFIDDGTAYQQHIVSLTPGSQPVTVRAVNPVTGWTVNNVVRSQRRREYGVGQ
jgi:hypothetical protein